MGILLIILKWIGLVVLGIIILGIVLLALALFFPASYKGTYEKMEQADNMCILLRISWLFSFFQYQFRFDGDKTNSCCKILGIPIRREWKKNHKQEIPKSKKHKKLSAIENIKQLVQRIKHVKSEIFNSDNKTALGILVKELKVLVSHWGPRTLKADLAFSMGDPSNTGLALAIVSVFPIIYKHDVLLKSDFESDNIYLTGNAEFKGRIQVFHGVRMFFVLFTKNETRKIFEKLKNR